MTSVPLLKTDHFRVSNQVRDQLRIALFSGNYNYIKDGASLTLNRLVAFLERRNIPVLVISPTSDKPAFEPTGTLLSVPSIPIPMRPEYRFALGLPKKIRQQIEQFKPTIFHLSAPDALGFMALRLAQKNNLPVVASFHTRYDTYLRYYGFGWAEALLTRYLKYFYSQCAQVYVPSDSIASVLQSQGVASDLKHWSRGVDRTLFNPQKRDLAWRRSYGISDDDVVISFTGRLVLEKGLKVFVDTVNQFKSGNVPHRVMIIGDGPERKWLERRLPNAVFTGFLHDRELARAYASSDIFLFPSTTETFGNVTLEAMASGLPAVCADATGSQSLVKHGVTGFLADAHNVNAYAAYLEQLVLDAGLRQRMGEASLKQAAQYDIDIVMERLLGYYMDALAGSPPPSNNEQASPQGSAMPEDEITRLGA